MDGGHLGRMAFDALARGLVTWDEIRGATDARGEVDSIFDPTLTDGAVVVAGTPTHRCLTVLV